MTETRVARVTGIGALACVALSRLQFPLWVIGDPPSMYDGAGVARHLFDIRTMALLRVRMDQGIYVAAVWLAVTLVDDGLMGGAVLDTLRGDADASAVRALVMGTVLIYNGSIAFSASALAGLPISYGRPRPSFRSDMAPRFCRFGRASMIASASFRNRLSRVGRPILLVDEARKQIHTFSTTRTAPDGARCAP